MKEEKDYGVIFGTIGAIIVLLLFVAFLSIYTVSAGDRAVVSTFGNPNMVPYTEGLHFKIPLAQSVRWWEVRTQKIEAVADSASADLQDVQTTIALNFHLIPENVAYLQKEIGTDYQERIIDPAIQEAVKAVTAQFKAEELITRRPEVRDGIQLMLKEKLVEFHIEVDALNIVNFQFSEEFDKAIEAKVTAEQLKLKAEKDLERIVIEKEQIIATAQAEAEALRLQKEHITPELVELRKIEVQRLAIERWDGVLPKINNGVMPFINVGGDMGE